MEFSKVLASHVISTTPLRHTMSKREKLLRWLRDNGVGVQEAIGWLGASEGGKR